MISNVLNVHYHVGSPKRPEDKMEEFCKNVDFSETIEHQIIQWTILANTSNTRLDYEMTYIKKMK